MAKVGRNAPCPCGSGKKYKRCCLPLQEGTSATFPLAPQPIGITPGGIAFYDEIDQLSNSVLDLIQEGKLDEAERVCKQLSKRYPDQVDGIERMAQVQEARGNLPLAAEYYRKAAAFVKARAGFDREVENWLLEQADNLEKKSNGS